MSKSATDLTPKQLIKLYRSAIMKGVPLDKLEKKVTHKIEKIQASEKIEREQEKEQTKKVKKRLPWAVRFGAAALPVIFISIGLLLVGNALVPISQYYLSTLPSFGSNNLKPPIPREEVLDVTPQVIAQTENADQLAYDPGADGPKIIDTELDYTNLSNWLIGDDDQALQDSQQATAYTIDIPELDIEGAEVLIGGTDLNKSLIAYPGTALPGSKGAPVIFGHSVLRQFYNPSEKNPRRYNSIFSTIMTLNNGDEIQVTHDGATYTYRVRDKSEVKPEDTHILAQRYDVNQLKLVTCVPEGTYLRRGVVTAELVRN